MWITGRSADRLAELEWAIRAAGATAHSAVVDLGDPAQVDALALRIIEDGERLDGIIHSAGALAPDFTANAEGVEMTIATHVLAPFRLTWRLAPLLRASGRSTIVTVSSGGMYTERFDVHALEMSRDNYRGVVAYARAKRAQILLAHE